MNKKYEILINYLKPFNKAAVAFSGGVDSSLLLYAAKDAYGVNNCIAFTIDAPYIARWEIDEAKEFSKGINVSHYFLTVPIIPSIKNNPEDRCYLCKKEIFTTLKRECKKYGFSVLFDGTNIDDDKDYRPGLRALNELKIISPLKEAGLTKNDIREISKELGLKTWDKPAYACLLTRFEYNKAIDQDAIKRVELAENYLMDLGFRAVRVRSHGNLARIEVPHENIKKLAVRSIADKIAIKFKQLGFMFVTVDIQGYRTGSLNETILKN